MLKLVVIHIDTNYVSIQLHEYLKEESIWNTVTHVGDLLETVEKVIKTSNGLLHIPSCTPISYRNTKLQFQNK